MYKAKHTEENITRRPSSQPRSMSESKHAHVLMFGASDARQAFGIAPREAGQHRSDAKEIGQLHIVV